MRLKLYVVHGSHPCAAVEKALQLKRLDYRVFEWPPTLHAPMQTVIFGGRTVPGLRINGEKVQGSRAILRRLDELAPEPRLYPTDPVLLSRVEEAETWGDTVFQPVARELIWAAMVLRPDAMVSYSKRSRLRLPAPAVRLSAPAIARIASRLNQTNADVARRDLAELPAQLDKIDAWIADATIGDAERPNAADLQILSTLRLMLTMGDARALITGRPCAAAAQRLFNEFDGDMPAGAIPAGAGAAV
jgi:glutathione S-transferase